MTSVAEDATGGGAATRPWRVVGQGAAALAVALRHRFPHHLGPLPRRVHAALRAAAEG
ncbi:hypothetical protein [Nonomuraea sp. NPDC049695]|uniref:hypothetical protein n=1 Tax=Nonomuraea sp. NPDC049695 TaxID=3154734 RepID=UPI0034486476